MFIMRLRREQVEPIVRMIRYWPCSVHLSHEHYGKVGQIELPVQVKVGYDVPAISIASLCLGNHTAMKVLMIWFYFGAKVDGDDTKGNI